MMAAGQLIRKMRLMMRDEDRQRATVSPCFTPSQQSAHAGLILLKIVSAGSAAM